MCRRSVTAMDFRIGAPVLWRQLEGILRRCQFRYGGYDKNGQWFGKTILHDRKGTVEYDGVME